jgi:hypothetical protein
VDCEKKTGRNYDWNEQLHEKQNGRNYDWNEQLHGPKLERALQRRAMWAHTGARVGIRQASKSLACKWLPSPPLDRMTIHGTWCYRREHRRRRGSVVPIESISRTKPILKRTDKDDYDPYKLALSWAVGPQRNHRSATELMYPYRSLTSTREN